MARNSQLIWNVVLFKYPRIPNMEISYKRIPAPACIKPSTTFGGITLKDCVIFTLCIFCVTPLESPVSSKNATLSDLLLLQM